MARPPKTGLDYFPLDTHLEDKVKVLEAKTGLEGFAVLVHLYQKIYRNGYFMEWKEENQLLFTRDVGADGELIDDVITTAIEYDIFDEKIYREFDVLTSHGIQVRYMNATARRKKVPIIQQYLLLDGDEVNDNVVIVDRNRVNGNGYVNGDNNEVNVNKNPTKERKGKERKDTTNVAEKNSDDEPDEEEKIKFGPETEVYVLTEELVNRIEDWHDPVPGNVPDPEDPEDMQKWCKDMDRLLRLGPKGGDEGDGPSIEQVEYILHWIYDVDDFWRDTIQSPIGIRENISTITAQIRRWKRNRKGSGSEQLKGLMDWAADKDREEREVTK